MFSLDSEAAEAAVDWMGFEERYTPRSSTPVGASEESSNLLSGQEPPAYENDKSDMPPSRDQPGEPDEVDLHGMGIEKALRRVAQELHSARVRGCKRLVVITGAGWGNRDQKPVLRPALEAWLRGPEGRALGVKDVQQVHRGGALELRLD